MSGTKNKMEDLRNHMFTALERLNDDEYNTDPAKHKAEIEKAQAIAEIGKVLVESAKVEVMAIKVMSDSNVKPTGFLELKSKGE